MKTKFDQKNFNLLLKGTFVLTKIIQVLVMISVVALLLVIVGALAIPSDLYNLDLSRINQFTMTIGLLNLEIPIEEMEGTINIRYLIVFGGITMLFYMGAFFYLFKKVEKFLTYVKNGTPFADENIHMMYHIGKVLVILSVVLPLITLPFAWRFAHALPLDVSVNMEIDFGLLILGLVVLLLASIFNYGAYLQEEYDQTV